MAEGAGGGGGRLLGWAIAALWAATAFSVFRNSTGDDLASVYLAAWFHAVDRPDLIYDYHPVLFTDVAAPEWAEAGVARGHLAPERLHPYVQPPLWAALLAPVAEAVRFPAFHLAALALEIACLVGAAALARRMWYPDRPGGILVPLLVLGLSWPFVASMLLAQIQPLVTLLVLRAMERDAAGRPGAAGLCLATAAALKLSPAVLGLYWLATGRWRSLGWAALAGAGWAALMLALVDWRLVEAFLERLSGLGDSVVLGLANAGVPALLYWAVEGAAVDYTIRSAPDWLAPAGAALLLGLIATAALRGRGAPAEWRNRTMVPAVLIGTAVLSPLAWVHYFTLAVLFLPALPALWGRWRGLALAAASWALISVPFPLVFMLDGGAGPPEGPEYAFPVTAGVLLALIGALAAPRPDRDRLSAG